MPRQSISFTEPNDNWMKGQIVLIRSKLESAEKSGMISIDKDEFLKLSKARRNG